MKMKSVSYAILYNETNPPLDIIQDLNRFEREPTFHRTIVMKGVENEISFSTKNAQKINFYSFAGVLPLDIFIQMKKKVEANYPKLDVHFVRNNETPVDFTLYTTDETSIPNELIMALGTFAKDCREERKSFSNEMHGMIPGTVFERVSKALKQMHPNIRMRKNA